MLLQLHMDSNHRLPPKCLVFDLGGGTFDVTVIEIDQNNIRVRSTDGDHMLGGKDWDDRLMKHVEEEFRQRYGIDISNDPLAQSHLRSRCVSGKLNLTMRQETTIDFRHKNKALRLRITRDTFESLTEDLLKRCEERLHNALEEAEYTTEDIDTVLLSVVRHACQWFASYQGNLQARPLSGHQP